MSNFPLKNILIAKKSIHSLSFKLIFAIGGLILVGSLSFWYSIIHTSKEEMLNTTASFATTNVNLIQKSTHQYMLANNLEDVQKTLETMVSEDAISNIRVFDCRGKIAFASDREEVGKTLHGKSETCNICHEDTSKAIETLKFSESAISDPKWTVINRDGKRVLRSVVAIYNEKSCYTAACHFHPEEKQKLGILEADYSLANFDHKTQHQNIAIATFGIIFTAVLSVILCIILWNIVISPILTMTEGMEIASKGDLDHKVNINTKDELGMLAKTYNSMTSELKHSREKLENWAKELEKEVAIKTAEIKRGQEQYIHTEKLASLGRMAAGVAHELNSPLTGIVTFAHLLMDRIPEENKMDREDLEVIVEQAERCSKIIKGLLGFSRAMPAEKNVVDVNDMIEHAINMIQNQAKFHNVEFDADLQKDLPDIGGESSQIEQVFLNLFINAADAMNNKGSIHIQTSQIKVDGKPYVEIVVSDTGPGIPEEHLSRLFEPFFTTKPVGKGTGLGLAVSHGIIRKHGGHIIVKSLPGEGACFFVRLPVPNPNEQVNIDSDDQQQES
ncbi:MAG: HAMP domain-containing protein [Nitrospirota bacterium]|nr:MAG: HAMP domain-containing protein [Nitrospirota bacterium]